jgi:predicted nucleic acid binding AN1-type Zn finger protein
MKVKCYHCNKKIKSILPIKCKCENYYCKVHKIPHDHNCTYDYLKDSQSNLKKNLIEIKKSKVPEI